MDPGKWDIIGGIGLHDIYEYFHGLMVKSTDPWILGRHRSDSTSTGHRSDSKGCIVASTGCNFYVSVWEWVS